MRLSAIGVMLLLALALLLAPLAVEAQPAGKVQRLGILHPEAAPSAAELQQSPFWQAMHELGWVEGQNITVERRFAAGHYERVPGLVAELVQLKVDVLMVASTAGALAAKHATTTIPIVMMNAGDPVGHGLVASLARPGGNVTGLAFMEPEVVGKQLEFLKDVLPTDSRVAVLWNPTNPLHVLLVPKVDVAAQAVGVQVHRVEARDPDAFASAFAAMTSLDSHEPESAEITGQS